MGAVRSAIAMLVCLGAAGLGTGAPSAWARPKPPPKKPPAAEVGSDRTLEKQSAWEQKVMGDDGGKRADLKKIAAAQRLGDEARKNPAPEPPKKHKDPNKEGARAKNEATIGLPIASDEKAPPRRASAPAAANKKPTHGNSTNDELGALVATSLADDRKSGAASAPAPSPAARTAHTPARTGKGRGRPAKPAPSSLDRMFSAGAGK